MRATARATHATTSRARRVATEQALQVYLGLTAKERKRVDALAERLFSCKLGGEALTRAVENACSRVAP